MTVVLDGYGLTPAEVLAVARAGARVTLAPAARERMAASRAVVERLLTSPTPVYGISTGFGALANTRIAPEDRAELQHAIVRSHAAGLGHPVETEVVRALVLLRARTLAMGLTGVRPEVVDTMLALLNADLTPVVPEHGSLGASGDLAPLAHVALCLVGEGELRTADGRITPAGKALAEAGIAPLTLGAKEGLALINGTDGMLGMLLMAVDDATRLLRTADVAAAMSIEALLGSDRPFAPELHEIRPHPGQRASAANLRRLLAGSGVVASHRVHCDKVQDAYSMRCSPQVVGAARDALEYVRVVAERELASCVDNPVVLPDGRVESNGNFHGEPVAMAADFLAIAAAEAGSISERRTDRMLDATRSSGLPPFLAPRAGVDSGLMIAQYTAAGIVAENRRLAAPACVDSVPTSGMQEDHVSMGWGACRKLRRVLENLAHVLAVEIICACAALDLRVPLVPAPGTGAVRALVRTVVPGPGPDRFLGPDLAAVSELVRRGEVLRVAESAVGPLE